MRLPGRIVRNATLAAFVGLVIFLPPAAHGQTAPDTQVKMVDFSFEPMEITVPLGSTVTWVYEDSQCDTIQICPGHDTMAEVEGPDGEPLWKSEVLSEQGETFTATMTQLGEIPYICTIHQSALADMDGVIKVVPAEEAPAAAEPGTAEPTAVGAVTPEASAAPATSSQLPATGGSVGGAWLAVALMAAGTAAMTGARTLRASRR